MPVAFTDKLLDFTPLYEFMTTPVPKTVTNLDMFEKNYNMTDLASVGRLSHAVGTIPAQARGGERNFMISNPATMKAWQIPFFPLDKNIKPTDVQNFLNMINDRDTPETAQTLVTKFMQRMRNAHATTKEKIRTSAIKGTNFLGGGVGVSVNYYTEWGLTQQTANLDFSSPTVDPASVLEANARAYIIDNKGDDSDFTEVVALCGRKYFQALIDNAYVRTAYSYYMDGVQPLRDRVSGNVDARSFEYKGIRYIEDIYGNIETNKAYIFPVGIDGMFHEFYAPADTIAEANTEAKEEYFWLDLERRTASIQSEFGLLAVNTRPELVVSSTGTNL
jgi:hypothetical protein